MYYVDFTVFCLCDTYWSCFSLSSVNLQVTMLLELQSCTELWLGNFLNPQKNRLNRYHAEIENLEVSVVQISICEMKTLNVMKNELFLQSILTLSNKNVSRKEVSKPQMTSPYRTDNAFCVPDMQSTFTHFLRVNTKQLTTVGWLLICWQNSFWFNSCLQLLCCFKRLVF